MNRAFAGEGDLQELIEERYTDDVLIEMGRLEGSFRGHAAVRRFFEGQTGIIEGLRAEPKEVIVEGSWVVVPFRLSGTARNTGLPVSYDYVHLLEIRGGKIARVRLYDDREKALAAARREGQV